MESTCLSTRCGSFHYRFSRAKTPISCSAVRSGESMLILGTGFVGKFFGQELRNQQWAVTGTCTSVERKKELENIGFEVHLFNANEPELLILDALKECSHMLVSIPPLKGIGDPLLKHRQLLRRALMGGELQWLGYLSSTGVYGACGGAWVDEDYPANPTTESGKLRLAAEKGWLEFGHDLGLSAHVFRLGGIYGPGRSAVDTIIKQESPSEGQKRREYRQYTSRIHVDDICQVLKASIQTPSTGEIYNVVDDDPAPREEVFAYAWDLVEKKWPGRLKQKSYARKLEQSEEKSWRGEKRVCNARIKEELGVKLIHPSYRSGLQSIVDRMENYCL